jgi:4-diphosphocytidyl-2-C-methyl-D-erythritol kinase
MPAADGPSREVWTAPAKVNLWLAVGPRRADGLHLVDTCYQAIDLADRIVISRSRAGTRLDCEVTGDFVDGIPAGEENLAARAARLLALRTGHDLRVAIGIEKRIPAGAGLAGASSDGAAVLLALARRFAVPDPEHTLGDLAAELGADVPFFLLGGTQRAGGIGDELRVSTPPAERWGILVWPGVVVPTGEAYAWLDAERGEAADRPLPPSLGGGRGNDFEAVVGPRVPGAGRALEILAAGPGRLARMSGSGSASFALYASEAERDRDLPRVREEMADLAGARCWRFECVGHGVRPEHPRRPTLAAG